MADREEVVCEDKDWLETVGFILEGQGVIWLLEEGELRAGGGGRPGVALIGGGRRGRSFELEGLGGGKDSVTKLILKAVCKH